MILIELLIVRAGHLAPLSSVMTAVEPEHYLVRSVVPVVVGQPTFFSDISSCTIQIISHHP